MTKTEERTTDNKKQNIQTRKKYEKSKEIKKTSSGINYFSNNDYNQ
jgi:hypothetical protein